MRVFVRSSKGPAVLVASGDFGRYSAAPGCDPDECAMQQFGLRQGPDHRRQGMVVAASIGQRQEHGFDALPGSRRPSSTRPPDRYCVGAPQIKDAPATGWLAPAVGAPPSRVLMQTIQQIRGVRCFGRLSFAE